MEGEKQHEASAGDVNEHLRSWCGQEQVGTASRGDMVDEDEIRKRFACVVSVTLHGEFYGAALDNLAAAIELQKKLDGSDGEGFESDHAEFQGMDRQYRTVLVAVVFSAMAAEALINLYGMSWLGEPYFERIDTFSLCAKWLAVPKMTKGVSLEPRREPFQGLDKLKKLRNKLVHFKPIKKTRNEPWKKEYRAASLDDAKRAVLTVHRLADWLRAEDPDFDLGVVPVTKDFYEGVQFLEAYECVLGERPR